MYKKIFKDAKLLGEIGDMNKIQIVYGINRVGWGPEKVQS